MVPRGNRAYKTRYTSGNRVSNRNFSKIETQRLEHSQSITYLPLTPPLSSLCHPVFPLTPPLPLSPLTPPLPLFLKRSVTAPCHSATPPSQHLATARRRRHSASPPSLLSHSDSSLTHRLHLSGMIL